VKLLTACHKVPVNCPASPIRGLGGEIMNVTQEFETKRIAVPKMLERMPSPTWIPLREPDSQSQP
jgi:hypothetical protein